MPPGMRVWVRQTGLYTSYSGSRHNLGGFVCPHIIVKGRGFINSGSEIKEVGPGDMFTILDHAMIEYYDQSDNPWQFYWLHLEGAECGEWVRSLGFSAEEPWLSPEHPNTALYCFSRIFNHLKDPSNLQAYALAALLFEMGNACKGIKPETGNCHSNLVERAENIIDSQLHVGLNINELAANLRVDRTTLFHAFKKHNGCSPVEFLQKKRITRACEMLTATNRNLKEISMACGFNSYKYLIKNFKKFKGVSPGEFRKKHLEMNKD